jgi:hypothetical protein
MSDNQKKRKRAVRGFAILANLLLLVILVSACHSGSSAASSTSAPASASATGTTSAAAASAGCPASNTTPFAKTKFVLHVGLAAGTFHRYIYKPFRAGSFRAGAHGRLRALLKASATALFDEHEVRKAIQDVKASPALCKILIAPLSALDSKFLAIKSNIVSGDTSGLDDANSSLASIASHSAQGGAPITESTDESQG